MINTGSLTGEGARDATASKKTKRTTTRHLHLPPPLLSCSAADCITPLRQIDGDYDDFYNQKFDLPSSISPLSHSPADSLRQIDGDCDDFDNQKYDLPPFSLYCSFIETDQ